MSVNKNQPHILILPEDDANRQLANGFQDQVAPTRHRQMQILEVAGGWENVLNLFQSDHIPAMERYLSRYMILLIDFDEQDGRLEYAKGFIPDHLQDRVFILGTWSEPEDLKRVKGCSCKAIGLELGGECRDDEYVTWGHDLLQHNKGELDRLREHVRPILFDPA